jgi:EAL domain-containing protein (putative c-di-GMP-specific phosphodiesterase class I)/ActR/RegA family two-component response regulator
MQADTPRLLVLDDEAALGQVLVRLAQRSGWVAQATTTVAAFQAQFDGARPDAIMLDLQLGSGDGVEQLRFLHDRRYDGSIALMSGFADRVLHAASELGKSLGLAIVDAVSKPASNDRIKALLDSFIADRTMRLGDPVVLGGGAPTGSVRSMPIDVEPLSAARVDQGLSSGELTLEYQPIVNSTTRQVDVLEALARWHHPTRGRIMPDIFIPITEQEPGVIDRFTQWVVRTAGAQVRQLRQQGVPASIAVNISARNLRQLDFPDRLLDLVTELGLSAAAITLEITESAATGDPTVTKDILTRLRLKGFRLAMDDFGTGFSSLKALLGSPFSELKIDKSFVGGMLTSPDARVIVKSTIRLAQEMGLKTVAEGVETQDVHDRLVDFGVDHIQGYHISRPMAANQVSAWMTAWPSS